MSPRQSSLALLLLLTCWPALAEPWEPLDARGLRVELKALMRSARELVRVDSLAVSPGGEEVWHVELGLGSAEQRARQPAMLLVAGVDGSELLGTSIAVDWIGELLEAHASGESELLHATTIHVVPRLSPDAAARYFMEPRMEGARSPLGPVDDDHDGLRDEDPPDDLDGDGLIRFMRVRDARGTHVLDEQDGRLLIEADGALAEVGVWRIFREGRDEDGDENFNEDGRGGVNIDRNFPHGFEWFAGDSGVHQVSEPESRGLADFLVDHPNIGLVFTFGADENLVASPKVAKKKEEAATPQRGRRRFRRIKPPKALHADDLAYYEHFGKSYREALGLDSTLKAHSRGGSFSSWAYFHRGLTSLAARAWSPELQIAVDEAREEESPDESEPRPDTEAALEGAAQAVPTDTEAGSKVDSGGRAKGGSGKKGKKDERGKAARATLAWFDENAPESFAAWTPYEHPDFPGQRVELGGHAPYALTHPPAALVEENSKKQRAFLKTAAESLPRVGFRSIETRHLGRGVHEVIVQVENLGYLPTLLAHGELTREMHPTRLEIDLKEEAFLAGTRITRLDTIPGSGGMREVRLVILVKARQESVALSVVSALGGTVDSTIALKGAR